MDDLLRLPFLHGLQRTGIRPGLTRMRRLMARLGHPEQAFAAVLVTGTNGKGSTAAFLDSVLRAAGHRVGLFTSPHLVDVRERIRIGGKVIDAKRFQAYGERVRAAMAGGDGLPAIRATFFEALSAIGFLAFAHEEVMLVVAEVGMGGRLDSTNVLDPWVSVLTNVSLDHQHYLGATREAIAAEKVEVARPGAAFVTAVDDALYDAVVGPRLAAIGALPVRAGRDFRAVRRDDGRVDWQGRRSLEGLEVGLPGTFQADNLGVALAAAEALEALGVRVGAGAMRRGAARVRWPGRLERVSEHPAVILDGCHNPGAAEALAAALQADPPARPLVLVHGTKAEKDFPAVLARLVPLCDAVVETTAPGLADPATVAAAARAVAGDRVPIEVEPDLRRALDRGRALAGGGGTVLVTGSLYLVGAVKALKLWL